MRALITGIAGQDGPYLAEHLLSLGDEVLGLARPEGSRERPTALPAAVRLLEADLRSEESLAAALVRERPDEIYNLAARSFVPDAAASPASAAEINALAAARLLEAVRRVDRRIRVFQASSAEMFGHPAESPQNERTPFQPATLYGAAKLYAHRAAEAFRRGEGIFAACGILFNHESPRRDPRFVTRKITQAAARIAAGRQSQLALGNLEARRDWGFAGDFVQAMPKMLRRTEPADFVLGTGESHSVRDLLEEAFGLVGLDWTRHVVTDPSLVRPEAGAALVADAGRARRELGWAPSVGFRELVRKMVEADIALVRAAPDEGPRT